MTTFYGTDTYSIDAKGRLAIPATARRAAGKSTFFLVPGFEGCLSLYTEAQWSRVEERLAALPGKRQERAFKRALLMNAARVTVDAQGRITTQNWDLYDTRHTVFRPAQMPAEELERGYWRAYRNFYRWRSIARGAATHGSIASGLRHFAYAAGWKKFEPLWDVVIRAKRAGMMLPVLETILSEFGRRSSPARSPIERATRFPPSVRCAMSHRSEPEPRVPACPTACR